VSAFPSYQAYPGAEPLYAAAPLPVLVAAADPVPQRRWTVLLRIILAVPHMVALYALTCVSMIIAFIGWWGALFTGRLPEFAVTFQSGYLRWLTRFNAYLCMLTDAWPSFTFDDDPSYPVRVAIPPPQRLNRAAVFFRGILIIPAWFLYGVLAYAMMPIGFVAWVITLITGRLPRSLHAAYLAVVRYQARVYGYGFLMLTPTYPGGLYGDGQATATWADAPQTAPGSGSPSQGYGTAGPGYGTAGPGYGTPQPGYGTPGPGYGPPGPGYGTPESVYGTPGYTAPSYGTPGYGAPGYGTPGYGTPGYGAPGYGAPGYGAPGYGAPGGYGYAGGSGRPVFQPATWLLRLTAGARRWVTAFIVIGTVFLAGETTLNVMSFAKGFNGLGDTVQASIDLGYLGTSHATLDRTISAWETATANCDHKLTCVTKQDGKAAQAFGLFADQIGKPVVPSAAAADQNRLIGDARTLEQDFTSLGQAKTVAEYQDTFTSTGLQQELNAFDADYTALVDKLQPY
jgi:hypothetical protein